jgi:hypothetical protein
VKPQTVLARDLVNCGQWIDRAGADVPGRADDEEW